MDTKLRNKYDKKYKTKSCTDRLKGLIYHMMDDIFACAWAHL